MLITSPAFREHGAIPRRYTCDGADVSQPLAFEGVPRAASALALVVDDPDAPSGTWHHWVVWDIPAGTSAIAEGQPPAGTVGRNSWRKNRYGGPCPPRGEHRYRFTLYALDTTMELTSAAGPTELARAMTGHVLATSCLVGRYARHQT
jgi:Raf kinase inhibitor-like YbhB/YbcL family protein